MRRCPLLEKKVKGADVPCRRKLHQGIVKRSVKHVTDSTGRGVGAPHPLLVLEFASASPDLGRDSCRRLLKTHVVYTVLKHSAYWRCFATILYTNWLTYLLACLRQASAFYFNVIYISIAAFSICCLISLLLFSLIIFQQYISVQDMFLFWLH